MILCPGSFKIFRFKLCKWVSSASCVPRWLLGGGCGNRGVSSLFSNNRKRANVDHFVETLLFTVSVASCPPGARFGEKKQNICLLAHMWGLSVTQPFSLITKNDSWLVENNLHGILHHQLRSSISFFSLCIISSHRNAYYQLTTIRLYVTRECIIHYAWCRRLS